MTIHGTSRTSLERAFTRAIARDKKRDKINAWYYNKSRHIRNPEAYQQAIEDNERLGIQPVPKRTRQQGALHAQMAYANTHSKRKMDPLPGVTIAPKVDERGEAEKRMTQALRDAIDLLTFHLTALTHIPNPTNSYRNSVNQQALFETIRRLACCAIPPLQTHFDDPVIRPRVALTHVCIDCGGPASDQYRGKWYCDDCHP